MMEKVLVSGDDKVGRQSSMVKLGEKVKKKIAIIGLPNTGKSQIFNNLTGDYSIVANYPFTTVEIKRKHCWIRNQPYEVFDTPGLHCLYIHSEEELIVRDLIFSEKPDVIIQCIDSSRLKQSLTLTADLLELGIPMVISLNAIDETARKGMWVDSNGLSRLLGVLVVESIALIGLGTEELKDAIGRARKGRWSVRYGELIENGISAIESKLPEDASFRRKVAVLMLLHDPFLEDYLRKVYGEEKIARLRKETNSIRRQFRGNLSRIINNKRSLWVDSVTGKVIRKQKIALGEFSQVFARLSRHPVWGFPILLTILFIVFYLVVNVANRIADWMNQVFWIPLELQVNSLIPAGLLKDFLIGDYGVLTLGISNAILTVLPILGVFFILFSALEDIGYIPNLCVLAKRFSEKIGLTGRAILPVTLAFGCKTMATLTTRSLRSKRERYIAVYLIAFAIPCAAQMGLNMSILGRLGVRAFIIVLTAAASVWISVGLILNRILKEEEKDDFIQELPAMRWPNLKAILRKAYYKLCWFLKEAMPVFISAAIILFVADKTGLLATIKHVLRPVITGFLGFPLQMVDVLILCMAKHEVAAGMLIKLIQGGQLNYIQSVVALTLTMMFVPCLANIMAMIKELGAKTAVFTVFMINCTGILVAGVLNWILVVLFRH